MNLTQLLQLPDQHLEMPALFIGHGSPLNAIEDNKFTQHLKTLPENFPTPKAVIIISAHWETYGTEVLGSAHPELIYDFWGFPKELYELKYPASGDPQLAKYMSRAYNKTRIDHHRGLDHGAWALLLHLFPKANIPILQVSLDQNKDLRSHFTWANQLRELRRKGVLIIGSGNLVHNLRKIDWNPSSKPFDWAVEFDGKIKQWILDKNWDALLAPQKEGSLFQISHPSLEHYLPIIYTAGVVQPSDSVIFPHEEFQNASISMRSVMFTTKK